MTLIGPQVLPLALIPIIYAWNRSIVRDKSHLESIKAWLRSSSLVYLRRQQYCSWERSHNTGKHVRENSYLRAHQHTQTPPLMNSPRLSRWGPPTQYLRYIESASDVRRSVDPRQRGASLPSNKVPHQDRFPADSL